MSGLGGQVPRGAFPEPPAARAGQWDAGGRPLGAPSALTGGSPLLVPPPGFNAVRGFGAWIWGCQQVTMRSRPGAVVGDWPGLSTPRQQPLTGRCLPVLDLLKPPLAGPSLICSQGVLQVYVFGPNSGAGSIAQHLTAPEWARGVTQVHTGQPDLPAWHRERPLGPAVGVGWGGLSETRGGGRRPLELQE